jgi:hypothetical protein
MPDPTTPAKGLTQPTVGADNNTWGGLLNIDLSLIDSALGGTLSKSISGTTTSLSGTDGATTARIPASERIALCMAVMDNILAGRIG